MTKHFSTYDTRHYPTVDAVTGYDMWASTYDQTVDPRLDITLLTSLRAVNWAHIHTAIDLACGTGRLGKWVCLHFVGCETESILSPRLAQNVSRVSFKRATRNSKTWRNPGVFHRIPARLKRA